jgi:hypothetical protein
MLLITWTYSLGRLCVMQVEAGVGHGRVRRLVVGKLVSPLRLTNHANKLRSTHHQAQQHW